MNQWNEEAGTEPFQLHRNIELKARLTDIGSARRTASRCATVRLGFQEQRDTYYSCSTGRLKLREIGRDAAQLIWYARPDLPGARGSDYWIVDVSEVTGLCHLLSRALPVRAVVEKRREIYLYHNVRIHLDEVTGLGNFLEFEAVLGPGQPDEFGQRQLDELCRKFGIATKDLMENSYGELVGTSLVSQTTP